MEHLAAAIAASVPLAWWRFDEASGSTFADSSGNGRSLTIAASTPTFQKTSILPSGEGKSVQLRSTKPASAADAAWNSITGPWTILVHVRPFDAAAYAGFLTKNADTGYGLMIDNSHDLYAWSGGTAIHQDPAPLDLWDGTFKQLVATFDGSTLSVYANNVLFAATAASAPADTSGALTVGSATYGNMWDGQDFALWDRALAVSEIDALWTAANSPPSEYARYRALEVLPGSSALANVAIVTRDGVDDVRAADNESVGVYGHRSVSVDVALSSESDVEALAEFHANRRSRPTPTVARIDAVIPREGSATLGALAALDLGALVTVHRTTADGRALDYSAVVEGLRWDFTPGRQSLSLSTSPSDTYGLYGSASWFTIGESLLGGTAVLAPY